MSHGLSQPAVLGKSVWIHALELEFILMWGLDWNYLHMTYPKKLSPKLKKSLQGSDYLLSYYLANKWTLHIRSQDLEISTLIKENKKN